MSGELEAAGALVTAGAVAGAIEGREPGQAGDGQCANCGAKVKGRYCQDCGQATHANRKLFHLIEEVLHSLFHLDTKLWRTLPMAIFRPGTLTRNYVFGKRARYISPLALFLFTIFLMFFAVSFLEAPVEIGGAASEQRAALAEGLSEARAEVEQAERELAAARAAPPPTDGTPPGLEIRLAEQAVSLANEDVERRETSLARLDALLAARQAQQNAAQAPTPPATASEQTPAAPAVIIEAEMAAPEEDDIDGIGWAPGETWQDGVRRMAQRDDIVVVEGMPELNERVRRKFENPDLALYRIQDAASKFSFLLAPLSLPFIMLLFLWKRGTTMYDHIVFALYALSFAALLFVAVILSAQTTWTNWLPGWLLLLGLPAHTFFHLKGAYALRWWSALWRTFFMLMFATIILSIFIVWIVILGLAG
ncbi:MAG: DUF3667 domain-containing protein [Phycisphaerales bacterium]|nr:DUF3667 domain-containing protein [Hyphomonadaceae bacterium]